MLLVLLNGGHFLTRRCFCHVVDSIEKCKKSLQKFLLAMLHEAQPLKLPKHVHEHKVIWFTQDSFPML